MGKQVYTEAEKQWMKERAKAGPITMSDLKRLWPFGTGYNWNSVMRTIRHYKLQYEPEPTAQDPRAYTGTYTESGETAEFTGTTVSQVKTLDDLFAVAGVDQELWECSGWSCKAYQGYIKNEAGEIETTQLHSVQARFRRRHGINWRKALTAIVEDAGLEGPALPQKPLESPRRLLELSIPDLHAGKLAWGEETGTDYDTKIALTLFDRAVTKLIESSRSWNCTDCLLVVGNDLFNVDNAQNQTTRGTPQDVDTRNQKVFQSVQAQIIRSIEHQLAPMFHSVTVLIVPGNHDSQTAWFLGEVLRAYFRNCPGVTVQNPVSHRKYFRYGKTLLGFAHGDNEKPTDLPILMATEAKADYAETLHHEWHLGHIHRRKTIQFTGVWEERGCVVRFLPSLCGTDAWHSSKGYSLNQRAAEAFVWDYDQGLCGTSVVSIQSLE